MRWPRKSSATCDFLEEADRKIFQVEVGIDPALIELLEAIFQQPPQIRIALAHRNPDALAEITFAQERTAAKGAATAGVGAVEPERERHPIAERQRDFARLQRGAQRRLVLERPDLRTLEH